MMADEIITSFRRHGGRIEAARTFFPLAPQPWIDLSTGINPRPWSGQRADKAALSRLPDPSATAALEAAAAHAFGCDSSSVAAVPGADIGLRLLPWLMKAKHVSIVSPTYAGHADAWIAAGAHIHMIGLSSLPFCDTEVLIVVNPNNPDGAILEKGDLLRAAARQKARGGWMIVDESFADTMPEISVAPEASDRLIVLRSFGKFFGLPGARLGFILGSPDFLAAVRSVTGDWPVSADAVQLGRLAYADQDWQSRTRKRLKAAATRFDAELHQNGFTVIGGTPLFRLVSHPDAAGVFQRLARAGILVRPFDCDPNWLRFGVPDRAVWARVTAALGECRP